jgi:hypothetical protein
MNTRARRKKLWISALLCLICGPAGICFAALPQFDFTKSSDRQDWNAAHDISALDASADGLLIRIGGADPYIVGPRRDYPPGGLLWLRLRLKSDQGGMAQVFFYKDGPREINSIRIPVRGGVWQESRVPLPALGPGYRLRIDPPGDGGTTTLASLTFEERIALQEPVWLKPESPTIAPDAPAIQSGDLTLSHAPEIGGFVIKVAGQNVATGFNRPLIGYVHDRQQRWLDLHLAAKLKLSKGNGEILLVADAKDQDGATWHITQRFAPSKTPGAIEVETEVNVDRDRDTTFLPMLALLPGQGSFGQSKTQALFPGLEYLDKNEPSSSEADIVGPGARRQVPDSLKITFPLMAVVADGRYVGMIWEQQPNIAALFDSPDRIFKSDAHVMGLLFPGSSPATRIDASLLAVGPELLVANKSLKLRATIIGGRAKDVTTVVQNYVARRGLPVVPDTGLSLPQYVSFAAAGWLDSGIRAGGKFRHAYPGNFGAQPAADAALMMDWLASKTSDRALSERLGEAARAALAEVRPEDYNYAKVSHIRYPVESLLYGHVVENATRARSNAENILGRFEPDGSVRYRPGAVDYGKTHFAPEANGLTAGLVANLLESAVVAGDPKLVAGALRVLLAMDRFEGSVPRGAQTWEVPLHTPDILASAHLVRAYTLGYEITGERRLLDLASHWAWTGVPFVYLTNPTSQPVGPYATIAVLGATNWQAPNWMGLPVQWCGLVYADALYRLAPYDNAGPWRQLADGIAASGIQQSWPVGLDPKRQGLLPDSFALRSATRNDVAINPGTVQAPAIRLFKQPPIYDFHAFRSAGMFVHAPGELTQFNEQANAISFAVRGCMKPVYSVLISNCPKSTQLSINGRARPPESYQYVADRRWLILQLTGDAIVELKFE